MKHLVKKRYTVTRPRLLNMRNAQNEGTARTNCETRPERSAEKKFNFGNVGANNLNNPINYNTQIAPKNNQNQGFESVASPSGTVVTEKQMRSSTNPYLNASYLISKFTSTSNIIGYETSPVSDPARSELLGLNKKLLTALQRMERIQGRINSLESKFENLNECILTEISTSENVIQPPAPEPVVKIWHNEVDLNLREHLIKKLTNAVISTTVIIEDSIRMLLDRYIRKMEKNAFEEANSKREYYELLSKRHYALMKETDERRKKRKALQQK